MCLVVVGLEVEQVLTSRAAAAPDVADAAVGVEEGTGPGRRAVIGREAVGEDGRLYVAQEHRVVVHVVESGVCHGEDTVAFT